MDEEESKSMGFARAVSFIVARAFSSPVDGNLDERHLTFVAGAIDLDDREHICLDECSKADLIVLRWYMR